MLLHRHMREAWHRSLGEPEVPLLHDSPTYRGLEAARARTQELRRQGRLITPIEAMALAGRNDHSMETLYSIARDAAFQTDGDVDTILRRLEREWPGFA